MKAEEEMKAEKLRQEEVKTAELKDIKTELKIIIKIPIGWVKIDIHEKIKLIK